MIVKQSRNYESSAAFILFSSLLNCEKREAVCEFLEQNQGSSFENRKRSTRLPTQADRWRSCLPFHCFFWGKKWFGSAFSWCSNKLDKCTLHDVNWSLGCPCFFHLTPPAGRMGSAFTGMLMTKQGIVQRMRCMLILFFCHCSQLVREGWMLYLIQCYMVFALFLFKKWKKLKPRTATPALTIPFWLPLAGWTAATCPSRFPSAPATQSELHVRNSFKKMFVFFKMSFGFFFCFCWFYLGVMNLSMLFRKEGDQK